MGFSNFVNSNKIRYSLPFLFFVRLKRHLLFVVDEAGSLKVPNHSIQKSKMTNTSQNLLFLVY